MRLHILTLALLVLPYHGHSQAVPAELGKLRTTYEAEITALHAPVLQLNEKYRDALKRLQEDRAQTGNLESVLVVKEELERLGDGTAAQVENLGDRISDDAGLADLQKTYLRAREKIDLDLVASKGKLVQAYRSRLSDLEKELTRQQRIEEAVLVKKERESLPALVASAPLGESPTASPAFKARLHFVGKGEIEVYWNGKKVRYRNETKERGYVDGESSPMDVSIGDVVAIRIRGEAVFRGVIFGIESTDGSKHVQFSASSFRLVDTGDELDLEKLASARFIDNLKAEVRKSQQDPTMTSLWGPHGIKHCQFIQPPGKGEWAVFGAVITEEMIAPQDP